MNLADLQQAMREWLETGDPDQAARFGASAQPGLEVYLNNYRTQLLGCLERVFPRTRTWLGDTCFYDAARQHIMARPPDAWSLDAYPATFAAAAATLFPGDALTAELARLELAISDSQTAADRAPLTRDMLAEVDWDVAALAHASGGQVLQHRSNAAAVWSALARGDNAPAAEIAGEPCSILVWRCKWLPCFRRLDQDEAGIFAAMAEPLTFPAICAMLERELGAEAAVARAGLLLARWVDDAAISLV